MTTIANRIFDGNNAQGELEDQLSELKVPFERLGWDDYDCSIELYEVPAEYRLPVDVQKAIHAAGFSTAFVNHTNKWETHYHFKPQEDFAESKGWRVSYPHKRGENAEGIWVEELCKTWPKDWFDTGYCIVKQAAHT